MISDIKQYFSNPADALKGHRLAILFGGSAIHQTLHTLLESAIYRIHIVIYEFAEDAAGKEILAALIRARKRGCEVSVIYDAVGSIFTRKSFFYPLKEAGGKVNIYHSLWPLRLDLKFTKRNHRKIICIDGSQALIGGFNFSKAYLSEGSESISDLAVLIEGPAASQAYQYIQTSFQKSDGQKFDLRNPLFNQRIRIRRKSQDILNFVQVMGNDHFIERWRIRRELLFAFSNAKKSIEVMNPYFLPDPGVIKALTRAVKRGVRVRVLVPRFTDVRAIDLASTIIFHRLINQGVQIYRWPGFLHGKGVVIDEEWFSIGTFNLDYRSLFHNLEVVVNVYDPTTSKSFSELLEREFNKSQCVSDDDWKKMSLLSKVFAVLIYRLRAFL